MGTEELSGAIWKKWEQDQKDGKLKAGVAIWDVSPGYDLIPEIDLPLNHSYFLDGTHSCPPLSPLSLQLFWARGCTHGLKYVNTYFSLPTCYGWQGRGKDGGIYWSFLIETDEQKIKGREAKFKKAMQPYFDDFQGIWESTRKSCGKCMQRRESLIPPQQRPSISSIFIGTSSGRA